MVTLFGWLPVDGVFSWSTATLWEIAAKSVLLMALVMIAMPLLRRSPAAARHTVWATALLSLLLLPALALLLPGWRVLPSWAVADQWAAAEPRAEDASSAQPGSRLPDETNTGRIPGRELSAAADQDRAVPMPGPRVFDVRDALAAGALWTWLAGAALIALRTVTSLARLWHLSRYGSRITSGRVWEIHERLRLKFGLHCPVTLLDGPRDAMPMAWGVWRRFVLLPKDAMQWSDQRLCAVLSHELAHLKRRDPAVQLMAQATLALYWFNPLAWRAAAHLKTECERACDEMALGAGMRPCDYAEHLLHVVAGRRTSRLWSATALSMARISRVERRLAWIVAFRSPPRLRRRGAWLAFSAAVLTAAVPLAMIRAADDTPVDAGGENLGVQSADVQRVARLVALSEPETQALADLRASGALAGFDWNLVLEVDSIDTLPTLAAAAGLDEAQTDAVDRLVTSGNFKDVEQLLAHAVDPRATAAERTALENLGRLWQAQSANLRAIDKLKGSAEGSDVELRTLARVREFLNRQRLLSIFSVRQVFQPDAGASSSWTQIFRSNALAGEQFEMALLHAAIGSRIPIQMAGEDRTLFYLVLTAGDDKSVSMRITPGDPQVQPPAATATYELIRDSPAEIAAAGHLFRISYGSTWIARSSKKPTSSTAHLFVTLMPQADGGE